MTRSSRGRPSSARRDVESVLAGSALLSGAPPDVLRRLADEGRPVSVEKGTVLCACGEPGDSAFVIDAGFVRIEAPDGRLLDTLGRGESFGEIAVLTGEPRSAHVIASTDVVLIEIPGPTLLAALQSHPPLHANLARILAHAVRAPLRQGLSGARTTAVVGEPRDSVRRVARDLAATIAATGNCDVALVGELGNDAPAGPRVTAHEIAGSAAAFVEQISSLLDRFSRVVVVLPGTADPRGERRLVQCDAFYGLAPQGGDRPAGTGLRLLPEADRLTPRRLRSTAREILGSRVALVLGAGGAKGFAHAGALRAFERHGLEFDLVAGTSVGAVVGALVASGFDAATIGELLLGAAGPWQALLDPSSLVGTTDWTSQKTNMIRAFAGDRHIEDLEIPLRALAGDLDSLETVVFRDGLLSEALDASTAIPSVFEPVAVGARMLVDGWVSNPLPADVPHAEGIERIVAVDLSGGSPPPCRSVAADAAQRRLELAMRALEIGSRAHVDRTSLFAHDLVRPELDGFSSFDTHRANELVELGEEAAERTLTTKA